MRNLSTVITVFVIAATLSACGGRQASVEEDEAVVEAEPVIIPGTADSSGLGGDESLTGVGLAEETGGSADFDLLNQRVIYFEYDSSSLSGESRAVIEAHAGYLAAAPGTQVVLEGHADERGTREYNLSLGEDRAHSVAEIMRGAGVNGDDIQTISYGEERPVSLGSDESAWSLNRRVEILYQ